ncbi:hypothetical protein CA13_22270 [Planctomycetes bacterium CA13]|uniref:Uncharacterized protein n=1 Tax=Novipirellula herctigrandis TaxID=2527986 RepID=A0A5C5Z1T4_9BACT|nr:hypothetical protein CA13_22270 [Planctomycetes bacterium CA13]
MTHLALCKKQQPFLARYLVVFYLYSSWLLKGLQASSMQTRFSNATLPILFVLYFTLSINFTLLSLGIEIGKF